MLSGFSHLSAWLQNTYPDKVKSWRHVVYTCYQPRSMASAHDLELKAQAWERYQITTHLPAENIRVYDENFAKRTSPAWPRLQLKEAADPVLDSAHLCLSIVAFTLLAQAISSETML